MDIESEGVAVGAGSEPSKRVIIYTDGGCSGNPGPGGYGVVMTSGDKRREISGGFRLTTNNRMEIMAVIVGLEALKYPCDVTVVTDSKYVHDTIMKGWAVRWRAAGWMRNEKEAATNIDLWERVLALCAVHKVRIEWVKGHAGHDENERCDRLAVAAAAQKDLPADAGYIAKRNPVADSETAPLAATLKKGTPTSGKITRAGQACRKCGVAVERRIPKSNPKPGQAYYYEYYLHCPGCGTMYMVDEARRTSR